MMSKVNRWEAPEGFIAIENVGDWFSLDACAGCKNFHLEDGDEVCNHSPEESKCSPVNRSDCKNVTLREANKHYFIHTGRDECPKWLAKLAEEHPEWRFVVKYTDYSLDMNMLKFAPYTWWDEVKYFQIIPV
jgi:hypothetical protein